MISGNVRVRDKLHVASLMVEFGILLHTYSVPIITCFSFPRYITFTNIPRRFVKKTIIPRHSVYLGAQHKLLM